MIKCETYFATISAAGWLDIVEDALKRLKQKSLKDITFWESILYSLRFSHNTKLISDVMHYVTEEIGLEPTLLMLTSSCNCILLRTLESTLASWLLETTDIKNVKEQRRDGLPPDFGVLKAWMEVKSQSTRYGVQLDSECYNFILAALARSRHYDEMNALISELQTNNQFKMNVNAYIALITLKANSAELGDARLEEVNKLRAQAQLAPPSRHEVRSTLIFS